MELTEVRIKLAGDRDEKLKAYCTITLDNCFVVRDIKVILGTKGPFVAMPSRKLMDICPRCGTKNHLRARYCNECGRRLDPERAARDASGRARLHADIAHPINRDFRGYLERNILEAYERELARSRQPGYQPPADVLSDAGEDYLDDGDEHGAEHKPPAAPSTDDPGDHRFGEGILP
ncbi:MAG: stage V sporulation protein G [Planctomycetes bacterium]|nr:stage V sporulation protein G [Planctomycetota bacterium]